MRVRLLRSFRLRIALLVAGIPGFVLVAFAAWSWIAVERINMQRLDEQISRLMHRHVARPGTPPDWESLGKTLQNVLGSDDESALIMMVKGRGGRILYRSANWPETLSPARLRPPNDGRPPPPMRGNGLDEGPASPAGPPPPAYPPPPPNRKGWSRRDRPEGGGREYGLRERRGRGSRPFAGPPQPRRGDFFTWREGAESWRVGMLANRRAVLALGLNLDSFNTRQRQIRNGLAGATLVSLLLLACTGFFIAQRALRPVRALAATAERITGKGLDERIPLHDADSEFQRVINVFNAMMERLEKSFHQATRFSADAAHELRTPLTIVQGVLEQGVQEAEPESAEQKRYSGLLEEVQRLKNITRKLLLLSLADAGELKLSQEPLDFSAMIEEACEDIEALAPDLSLEKRIAPGVNVPGDPDLLRQVVQNITINAVQHNVSEGTISLDLRQEGDRVRLTVSNSGPGIPEADRDRVFERFHRVDKARSREKGGSGLGLSLAREIARAHRGDLTLDPSSEGSTTFTLSLPYSHESKAL